LHFLSILDFREFCRQLGVSVIRQDCFNGSSSGFLPLNLHETLI
jgi:hypothetical protein